jgi:hypothetical protein
MPQPTYTALATVTLGASASSVTFSSIPATYRDLIFVVNASVPTGGTSLRVRYNGDAGNNYPFVYIYGDGNDGYGGSGTSSFVESATIYTGIGTVLFHIMDYSATDKHKTTLSRAALQAENVNAFAARWANTAAITTIEASPNAGSFSAGSTFALYGIAS